MESTLLRNSQRLRVIYTTNYSPWSRYFGGGQLSTHHLACGMARLGHDVHVIYSKAPLETPPVPSGLPYKLHWASLPGFRSSRSMPLRPLVAHSVCRIAEELIAGSDAPVVLHANGEEAARVGKLKKRYRFGFIATPRYSSYPSRLAGWPDLSLKDRILLYLGHWKYLLQGEVLQQADRICPPSDWAGGEVRKIYNLSVSQLQTVYNGVPDEFLNSERSSPPLQGPILYFGRLSRDKGVDLLLEAYAQLSGEKPPLWIIGKGEAAKSLHRLSEKLGQNGYVQFIEWKEQKELAGLVSRSGIVVVPSRVENFSLSLLSAMGLGRPVISTRVGGTPEIIRDRENGLLVEPDKVDPLAGALTELLGNPGLAESLGREAARLVGSSRTWEHACSEFEKIYRDVIDSVHERPREAVSGNSVTRSVLTAQAV